MEEQLAELRDRTERLGRELSSVRRVVREQQHGVEGERLEEEAVLRRDQRGALAREQRRDREQGESGAAVLDGLAQRLRELEQHVRAEREQQRRLGEVRSAAEQGTSQLAERLAATEGQLAALADAWAGERAERARFDAALPGLSAALDELDGRTLALRTELRRADDEIAQVRARRDREDELTELVEQQHALRIRLEERLEALEARVEASAQVLGGASEERLGLGRQLSAMQEQLRSFGEEMEAQRAAILEHFGRLLDADQAGSRRQIEALEQRIRDRRRLAVGLREGSEQAGSEPPL